MKFTHNKLLYTIAVHTISIDYSLLQPSVSNMTKTHWYCSECGDGPLLIVNNVSCPLCDHRKCKSCTEVTIYPKHGTGFDRTSVTSSISAVVKNVDIAHGSNLALPVADTPASACCSIRNTIDIIRNHSSLVEPSDGEVLYRWTCCECGGDNSYDYQPGCTDCNKHWRCGSCIVYGIKV